ncbi:PAS domain S-box protein [Flavobacterium sp. 7A]|uniref:PAS domain S-box protein n=1 Tax=Flavobacterium sp. 7A TaxID=2940571 RepID=UPI00222789A3|nr:PAS domain S-box protein [Flavobacterium sp. 7A]MCW2118386.1 PAS domain S-box-containing protein [Flavobacterium sp. 7A]
MKNILLNYIDFKKIESLLKGFKTSTGLSVAILDLGGLLLAQCEWQKLQQSFYNINSDASHWDTNIKMNCPTTENFSCFKNLNGIVEITIPLFFDNKHIANLFSGYFISDKSSLLSCKKEAEKQGFDQHKYDTALHSLPIYSIEEIKKTLAFLIDTLHFTFDMTSDNRKQIELNESLINNTLFLENIIDNSPALIYVADLDGKIKLVNNEFGNIFQLDKSDIIGKYRKDIMPPAIAEQHRNNDIKVINQKESIVNQEENMEADGKHYYISQKFPLFDSKGIIQAVGGISTDITAIKRTKEALLKSEDKYKSLFNNSADGIIVLNEQSDILELNNQICNILEYSREELSKLKGFELIHIEDVTNKDHETVLTQLKQGKTIISHYRLRKKNGDYVPTEFSIKMIGEDQFLNIVRDITERKLAEKIIHDSELKYRSFFENSIDAILLGNLEGQILSANPAACLMYGCSEEELKKIGRAGVIDTSDPRLEAITAKRNKKEKVRAEITSLRKDGSPFESEISASYFLNIDNIQITSMIVRDITERKKAEKDLLESERILSVVFNNHTDLQLLIGVQDNDEFYVDIINKPYIDTINSFMIPLNSEAIIGKSVRVLNTKLGLGDAYFEHAIINYKNVVTTKKTLCYTEILEINGFAYTSEITLIPIMDDSGKCQYILFNSHNITEQKKAKNALIESEEKFKKIFLTSPDLVTITQIDDGMYIDVSENFIQISGYTREEIIGKTSNELNIWSDPKDRIRMISKLKEFGKVENMEAQFTFKGGQGINGLLSASILIINNKEHILTITRDITELIVTEQALKETVANLRSMIENREDSIYSIDRDFNYIIFNRAFENNINNEYNIVLKKGMSAIENLTQQQADFWVPKLNSVFEGQSDTFEFTFTIDEKIHYFQTTLNPIFEDQKITGASGISIDITKRKLIEEALKISEEKFEKTFRLSPYLVSLSTSEGEIIEVNNRVVSTLGYTREEFLGINTTRVPLWVNLDDRKNFADLLQKNGAVHDIEIQLRKKSGEISDFLLSACIIEVNGKELFLNIVHDITERKIAEKEIIKLNNELEEKVTLRTAQLEAMNKELETFTYSVSHDLKAPLRGIDGYSKLLSDIYKLELNPEAQSFIQKIRSSTLQMNQIIDDLLDYSRLERSKLNIGKIKIKELIETVLSSYIEESEAGYFKINSKNTDIEINADPKGFVIAFRNLIENAIKFKKEKTIPTILINIVEKELSWIISVNDNGIGFDMKYHHKIFDIFQRLQRVEDFPGTGIGLALVSKAMQRMNGKAWAESTPNVGSTFYLEIPKKIKYDYKK